MRYFNFAGIAAAVLLVIPSGGIAQQRKQIHIDQVRVGYGIAALESKFKGGFWTPVYVDVTAWPEASVPRGELVVESIDTDDVRNRYTVALPPLDSREQATVMAYTRPGSAGSEITVTARIDDRTVDSRQEAYGGIGFEQHLYLGIGSRLPGLQQSLVLMEQDKKKPEERGDSRDTGPRQLVTLDDVRLIPNRWFAFEPVDLMILTTGNRDFLTALLNEREGRKEALVDWVGRGGRLVVSVARNQDMIAGLEPIQAMLPVAVSGLIQLPQLRGISDWAGANQVRFENPLPRKNPGGVRPPVEIAKLERKPGREIAEIRKEPDGNLLIVRGAYGLGRVTVVAFDLDQPPLNAWPQDAQKAFWTRLLLETAPPEPSMPSHQRGFGTNQETEDLATRLQKSLEEFGDVPVISFGWVALFILLYILVVGPLDYFFLKKVVKRLELTWITFPTVVITISVAAYFTAYWLKGNDQRINKVDLLDIDLHTQQVYGNTWFTIFSPRIQHYTIGLEPSAPDWIARPGTAKENPSVTLTWMGRPEYDWAGTGRTRSQGLFRRTYDYVGDATGLSGVPIQVWSTKSFAASWRAPLDPKRRWVSADLRQGKEANELVGEIINRLPVDLEDVVLLRERKAYAIGRLLPDAPKRLENVLRDANATEIGSWRMQGPSGVAMNPRPQGGVAMVNQSALPIVKQLLFYQAQFLSSQTNEKPARDNLYRNLDGSWRLGHKGEVILFGRVARQDGDAESITKDKASPTRLWLGALPGSGQPRPELFGKLSQETYVRIIIPVTEKTGTVLLK